ncbi:MAG: indolepyruvate oxidoreductase subunit beta family protein [Alphaproteobacteria bacterium]|nr:indolepyruvate oxidoreductase subunit beta family protein [Alphaproteobacteria bacterium]
MNERPVTVLIAALGGEGGGVLADWVIAAGAAAGYPVQGTSIPGVAQRTGATTYYVEMLRTRIADLGGRTPIFALTPGPGSIDVMVASELLEAGRAMQNGFVNPERTTLIASSHRVYSILERTSMADSRYDGNRVLATAAKLAKRALFFDMEAAAKASGSVVSAVLFGAIAGSGALPIGREIFEKVICDSGFEIKANLAGFATGYSQAVAALAVPALADPDKRWRSMPARAGPLLDRVAKDFPADVAPIANEGIARLCEYQDVAYARLYLDRLDTVRALETEGGHKPLALTREVARHLAVWMAFEDVIRVADLKTRAARFARVRAEVNAKPDEPIRIVDYLKPGIDEVTAIMPPAIAEPILRWAEKRKLIDRFNVSLYIRTTSITGFLLMWILARLKGLRRRSLRLRDEMAMQERWLDAIRATVPRDHAAALEITECARLIKGYGSTYKRGRTNFLRIFDAVVASSALPPARLAAAVKQARAAALADPDGKTLAKALAEIGNNVQPVHKRAAE